MHRRHLPQNQTGLQLRGIPSSSSDLVSAQTLRAVGVGRASIVFPQLPCPAPVPAHRLRTSSRTRSSDDASLSQQDALAPHLHDTTVPWSSMVRVTSIQALEPHAAAPGWASSSSRRKLPGPQPHLPGLVPRPQCLTASCPHGLHLRWQGPRPPRTQEVREHRASSEHGRQAPRAPASVQPRPQSLDAAPTVTHAAWFLPADKTGKQTPPALQASGFAGC